MSKTSNSYVPFSVQFSHLSSANEVSITHNIHDMYLTSRLLRLLSHILDVLDVSKYKKVQTFISNKYPPFSCKNRLCNQMQKNLHIAFEIW